MESSQHLVSICNKPASIVVSLYASPSTNQYSYPNKQYKAACKKYCRSENAASDSPCKSFPYWHPAPKETPGESKSQWNNQNDCASGMISDRANSSVESDCSGEDPDSNSTTFSSRN